MRKSVTATKARKMIAAGQASASFYVRWADGTVSRNKVNRSECEDLIAGEEGHEIITQLAVSTQVEFRSHVNPVGFQVYGKKPGTAFIDIIGNTL